MPQTLLEGIAIQLQSAQNRLSFALRNFLNQDGPLYREKAEPKALLFSDQSDMLRYAERLNAQYGLQALMPQASATRYREALIYLDWLDTFRQAKPEAFQRRFARSNVTWLDVGAKNWSYLPALVAFLRQHQPDAFTLHGLEVDPHRRYADLRTRRQYAQAHIHQLPAEYRPNTCYHEGNILDWQEPVQVISHFLPFVFQEPHLAWGLPLALFQPQDILLHELDLLESQGILLIVNQGEAEADAQQALLQEAAQHRPIRFESLGQMPVRFIQYQYPRYGWICIKQAG